MDKSISNVAYIFYCSKRDFEIRVHYSAQELPLLDLRESNEYIEYQQALLKEMRLKNQDNSVFMSTPLACENAWQSDFFLGLESLFRLKKLMLSSRAVRLVCVNAAWCNVIKEHARIFQAEISFISPSFPMRSQFSLAWNALRYMYTLSKPFRADLKVKIYNIDLIFFSTWFQKTCDNYLAEQIDPYFGPLPSIAKQNNLHVATFCHIEGFKPANVDSILKLRSYNIFTYFSFLTISDVLSIYWQLAMCRIQMPTKYRIFEHVIEQDVNHTKWTLSLHALMVSRVLKKLSANNTKMRVLHTYEGNCWEKGCAMGAVRVIGYQHTGFSRALSKMKNSMYLMPQLIITSGIKVKEILIKHFEHHDKNLISAVALKDSHLGNYQSRKELPKEYKRILILLQGSPYDIQFVKAAIKFIDNYPAEVYLRQHPAFILNNIHLEPGCSMSTNENLYEDILQSDLILYNGTTAAMEAAYLGVPCVYIDYGTVISNDPFMSLAENILVQYSCDYSNLQQVITMLQEKQDLFSSSLQIVQEYFRAFFEMKSAAREQEFISLVMSV